MTNIFGGKVVDVAPGAVTVAVSGDPGKLYAFEMLVRPFGLLQLSRTGRITLLQSDANLDLPSLQEYSAGASPAKLEQDSARAQAGTVSIHTLPCIVIPAVSVLSSMPCHRSWSSWRSSPSVGPASICMAPAIMIFTASNNHRTTCQYSLGMVAWHAIRRVGVKNSSAVCVWSVVPQLPHVGVQSQGYPAGTDAVFGCSR